MVDSMNVLHQRGYLDNLDVSATGHDPKERENVRSNGGTLNPTHADCSLLSVPKCSRMFPVGEGQMTAWHVE